MAARDRPRTPGKAALLGLAVGITATIVAWGILVLAAINFGRDARGGASEGWLLLAAATVGAIACMFLAIIFAARLQQRLRGERPARSAAPPAQPAEDGVRPGDVVELEDYGAPKAPRRMKGVATEPTPEAVAPAEPVPTEATPAEAAPAETAPAETAPAETAPAETAPAETEPVQVSQYRSKHSHAAEPEAEESADSPAAAYRGKRAAR